ncbi:DUF4350 domain-containing protein [Streptomyces sp. NBC_01803]|uniref:DUF4350 domain-containing protein n=1 Tax=Streptomyces sp. NBC_01803 TaxID=2975946 RepID=UPI002DDA6A46|nr:DUF4350 domain-containing protein [Streptomyces sp. NBC_01803]WSA44456.1 DUF4350 domain-containing protein [Streptomyces sp. NBC_01803]
MSDTGTDTGTGTDTTAVSPDARRLWLRGRGLLTALALLVLAGALLGLLTSGDDGSLDPRSATQHGSRAIAELLADRGVDTTLTTTAREAAAATGPDTTLLVVRPEALTDSTREILRRAASDTGARLVLLAPGQAALDTFAPGVLAAGPATVEERQPDCADPVARRAGSARLGGYGYVPPAAEGTGCYPVSGLPTLVTLPTGPAAGETVLLGAADLLHNQHLDEDGNASLALQLLGARDHLVWYLPSGEEAPGAAEEESLLGLLDPGWRWATLQLALAVALAALWRARRLGPVVTERLPVTVRAAETTEGHARLYHRAGARDRAADALRAATRDRLAPLVGVAPAAAHTPEALPAAVAAHTGDAPQAVHALLFGPPPGDDTALVRLADDLDALERRVTPDATKGKDHSS